jgi:hypothetical protein
LKREDLRGKTAMAEMLIGVQQTAAFSLSATSPQAVSVREISTCRIQLFPANLYGFLNRRLHRIRPENA